MIGRLGTRWNPGVRARLLLAFFGISAFAVLAAAAGIYAFRQVGQRIAVVDARVRPTLSSLELSRSAERIIAAAPALLAATDRSRRDEVIGELNAETDRLNGKLLELRRDRAEAVALLEIEPLTSSLTANLAELKGLVARRLDTNERIGALRGQIIQTNDAAQRLLAPWLSIMDGQISGLLHTLQTTETPHLPALIRLQRATQSAQQQFSAAVDALIEASSSGQPRRLNVLSFEVGRTLRDLDGTAANLDPKLTPLFLEQVAKLREFAEGPNSIPEARKQELGLVAEGEKRLAENVDLSKKLVAAVDQLAGVAKRDIANATGDALSVQRTSTRILLALVGLSLMTSVLIVWLYVSRNIVHRLTQLSEGTLAIAGGSLHAPVVVAGKDEIAAMGRAVDIFRKNTLERDELLAEKAQATISLEQQVKQRTAELARLVEELRALGDVSQAVNSTLDLDTVLITIVTKATQLSGTDAGTIYVFDEVRGEFRPRANCGLDDEVIAAIKDSHLKLGEGAVGKAAQERAALQVPDLQDDSSGVLDVVVRAGFRALLVVPLLGTNRMVGALVVRRKKPGEFPKSTINLLQTFAAQSVAAIHNARLFDEIQAVASELRQREQDLTEKSTALTALSSKLAKYLAPQVYNSIFTGQQDVKIVTKRKKLTVCFSDLVGFTDITDQMESEDLTQLLNHYLTEMSKIALQYGATIDKYVGDAIVMFFGDPTTLGIKQDALACVQMALAMQKRVGELAEDWSNNGIETPLRCRIGIHTGYCTVGNFGSEDRMDYTVIGGTVNLASRLEHEAPPGGVLISFETYAHVRKEVRCEERGPVQVKGIAHPVATYSVVEPM